MISDRGTESSPEAIRRAGSTGPAHGIVERGNLPASDLCNELEAIADSLPFEWSRARVERALDRMDQALGTHVFIQETLLFPLLRRTLPADDILAGMLARSELEHAVDQCIAQELAEALDTVLRSGRVANPEMLGYMLRGFFQAQRRHMAWEAVYVGGLAGRCLTEEEVRRLIGLVPD